MKKNQIRILSENTSVGAAQQGPKKQADLAREKELALRAKLSPVMQEACRGLSLEEMAAMLATTQAQARELQAFLAAMAPVQKPKKTPAILGRYPSDSFLRTDMELLQIMWHLDVRERRMLAHKLVRWSHQISLSCDLVEGRASMPDFPVLGGEAA